VSLRLADGLPVGDLLGFTAELVVGLSVGESLRLADGFKVVVMVGNAVGFFVGGLVGDSVGGLRSPLMHALLGCPP
jgi:hypothetical protein